MAAGTKTMYGHIPKETGADLLGREFKDDDLGNCLVTAIEQHDGVHVVWYRPVSSASGDEEYSSVEEVREWVQKTENLKHVTKSLEER